MAEIDYISNFTFTSNENGSYFTYADASSNNFIRIMLEITGQLKLFIRGKEFTQWTLTWMRPLEQCDVYGSCGAFSICNQKNVSLCGCLQGFEPQCLIWKGDLFNLKQLASAGKRGQDWHVRVTGSEKDQIIYSANKKKRETAWIVIGVLAGLFFVLSVVMVIFRRKQSVGALDTVEDSLVLLKYRDLKKATKNFSEKLGEGGKDAISLLDYRLEGQADKDEFGRACKVSCWCIQDDEKDRPTMRQVVQVLEGVSDVGISPMPWFLQRLTELPIEAINYEETTSGSDSFSRTDVPSAFQPQIRSCSKEM
ncbi:hypothetical protein Pyn_00610 [Prunus yedoensis var. nudiflora]|uniref:S-locus glycoprotein domain-containing protein n=1 Tax=Prunus yedoensis var. nudiflora TaxID=2094558 RepID=A0A314YQK9_PRUYE|nr:hypothetical protein Pyn_00610 [Prunus yedoensis var. nudiflora]